MFGRGNKPVAGKVSVQSRGLFYVPRIGADQGIWADDRAEYIFTDFLRQISARSGQPIPEVVLKQPDTTINQYIQNYDLVAVMVDQEGSRFCWSYKSCNKLPQIFTNRVRTAFGIEPDNTILWSNDIFTDPKPMPARQVVFGQRPEKPTKGPSKKELAKNWAHPDELSKDEMDYLMGRTQKPPQP